MEEDLLEAMVEGFVEAAGDAAFLGNPITLFYRLVKSITTEPDSPSVDRIREHYNRICTRNGVPIINDAVVENIVNGVIE